MRQFITLSMLLLAILALPSCKNYAKDNELYIGTWSSGYTTIDIRSGGGATYDYDDGTLTKHVGGRAIIKNGKLKIRFLVIGKTYSVDQEPTKDDDGYYYMVLNGEVFYME